jgi:putative transposase
VIVTESAQSASTGPPATSRRWINRWKATLNAFDITFDGRVSAGRK